MKKINKFFNISNLNEEEGEIKVYGEIAKYPWKEYGETSAFLFTEELNLLKNVKRINLRINSPGGNVFEAQTMYNSLKQFAKDRGIEVVTFIEGVAASAATLLALAADKIKIGEGCLFMIHNPSICTSGYSNELRKAADLLDKIKENILDIYEKKSSLSREDIAQKMNEETWFTAKEAVEVGFADEIETFEEVKNNITNIMNCSCLKNYKNIEKLENYKKEGGLIMDFENFKKNNLENLEKYKNDILKMYNMDFNIENIKKECAENAISKERTRVNNLLNVKIFNEKQKEEIYEAIRNGDTADKVIIKFYNSDAYSANSIIDKIEKEKDENGINNIGEGDDDKINGENEIINAALSMMRRN